jgi:hypothetical protein
MEAHATILKQLKDDQKQFKKDHKDVFDENRSFNIQIKKTSDELIEIMKSKGIDIFQHEGVEFEVKVTHTEKHDMDRICKLVTDGQESDLKQYMDDISTEHSKVMTRISKKQKTND